MLVNGKLKNYIKMARESRYIAMNEIHSKQAFWEQYFSKTRLRDGGLFATNTITIRLKNVNLVKG